MCMLAVLIIVLSFGVVSLLLVSALVLLAGSGPGLGTGLQTVEPGRDYTLTANGISIVFAKRLAGAAWTMQWNGHDFVGVTEGNGGNMQSALCYDVTAGQSSEEENPTEAGNAKDYGGRTSSKWMEAARSANEFYTKCQMAYWIPPGTVVPSSPTKARGRGIGILSDTYFSKRVTIGYKGFPNVVRYVMRFECDAPHWFTQIEVLTGYMPNDFNKLYVVDRGQAKAVAGQVYLKSPPAPALPLIVAKNDAVAIGVWAESAPPNGTYAQSPWYTADTVTHSGHRPGNLQPVRFSKWNVVWHAGRQTTKAQRIPSSFQFSVCLVIGSVAECAATIGKLISLK